jgi:hypothetical protein
MKLLQATWLLLVAAAAPAAWGGVVESYESGLGNVSNDGSPGAPTIQTSTDWATNGTNSAKYTLNASWNWIWNYHNVLPSVVDVAANKYLLVDFNVVSGQFKLGGIGANSNAGWMQQDAWNDALTPPGGAGQILQLPDYSSGENRGYGVFNAGATGTFVWNYKARGLNPTGAEMYLSFQFTLQGPQGSVIHLDNLRVANNIPEPTALACVALAACGALAARRRRTR